MNENLRGIYGGEDDVDALKRELSEVKRRN